MKNTGIIKKIDNLGRVVIPKEVRASLGFNDEDVLEMYVDNERLVIQKKVEACVFCGTKESGKLSIVMNKSVCTDCKKELEK